MMKLLVAYDGSKCSDLALDDLTHAGLPEKGGALVMTVAEVWLPPAPPSVHEIVAIANNPGSTSFERKYKANYQAVVEANWLAAKAAERFQAKFPKWTVKHEVAWGSPTWELFSAAEEFEADLILVGSEGRTGVGRFFLGSISQWLLNEARCSVRIARGKVDEPASPVRLIIGIDGSHNANLALEHVGERAWPNQSEIRVVVVDQRLEATLAGEVIPLVGRSVEEANNEEYERAQHLVEKSVRYLREKGLRAEGFVKVGDPKRVLVKFAEEWHADSIFLGATGMSNRLERFLLGSVAGAVAARAHCSVEIVRRRRPV